MPTNKCRLFRVSSRRVLIDRFSKRIGNDCAIRAVGSCPETGLRYISSAYESQLQRLIFYRRHPANSMRELKRSGMANFGTRKQYRRWKSARMTSLHRALLGIDKLSSPLSSRVLSTVALANDSLRFGHRHNGAGSRPEERFQQMLQLGAIGYPNVWFARMVISGFTLHDLARIS
jgi:hypothetical protein